MRQTPKELSEFKDLKELDEEASLEDIIKEHNRLIASFNYLQRFMTLSKNFDGYVTEVVLPATTATRIQHFLGKIPKYRIVLRQDGNGVISDIPSGWTDTYITLYNNGATEIRAVIFIVRE